MYLFDKADRESHSKCRKMMQEVLSSTWVLCDDEERKNVRCKGGWNEGD